MIDSIVGYTYKAEQLCPDCTRAALGYGAGSRFRDVLSVENRLNSIASRIGLERDDESSFDSNDFPKVILDAMLDCDREELEGQHERCDHCNVKLCEIY